MSRRKTLLIGIAILIFSGLIGTFGTLFGVHNSFDSLKANEAAGIGQVGAGIEKALISALSVLSVRWSARVSSSTAFIKIKRINSFYFSKIEAREWKYKII